MTDRLLGLTVELTEDIREDDAERIIDAIRMIKGVGAVTGIVADPSAWVIKSRVKSIMTTKILNVIDSI